MNNHIYKAISVAVLFFVLALNSFAQPTNNTMSKHQKSKLADQTYEKAQKLSRQGEIESLQTSLLKFNEALKLFRELGNKKYAAYCLAGIGYVNSLLGERQKALNFYDQAIKLSRTVKDDTGIAETLSSTGLVYRKLDENEKALKYFQDALPIAQRLRNRELQAKILTNIGVTYFNLSRNKEALNYYERALQLRKTDSRGEANTLNYLALVYIRLNEKEKALMSFERALSIRTAIDDKRGLAETMQGLGWFYFTFGDTQKALEYLNPALALARNIGDKNRQAILSDRLQMIWTSKGNLQAAIFYGKQSVNLYQELRKAIQDLDEDTQKTYLRSVESSYRRLADNLIAEARFPEAQAILELLKAEEYDDLTRGSDNSNNIPYNQSETDASKKIDKLVALGSELTELQKQKKQLGVNFPADKQKQIERIASDLKIANAEFENTLNTLLQTEISVTDRTKEIKSEENLQSALFNLSEELNTGTVALYTVIGTEEVKDEKGKGVKDKNRTKFGWVILVTPDDRKAYPIDVKNLEKLVFEFRAALSSEIYDPQPLAEKIYNAIFRQTSAKQKVTLEQDLEGILGKYKDKTLMWSLDGVLRYIPMAALHDGKQYLIEKYRSAVFTKESLLWLMAQPKTNAQVLGLGVSVGNKDLKMSALPGVEKELADVVRQESEKNGILLGSRRLNGDFKKEEILNLKERGNPFQIVHIASHYSFNPADQNASFLLIGDNDGKLTFSDMKTEKRLFGTVDLLTLSACDTGVSGNGKEAEGFAYLAQSLGAKSVIASLWKVSDTGTPELMIRFYKLRTENPNLTKGEAFRQAQLSLLAAEIKTDKTVKSSRSDIVILDDEKIELPAYQKDLKKPYAHPHYWASFVLIGNWR